ncbi:MAG: type ISP restriction/modification enzyme, partial [Bacteroidota bacterium]
TFVDSPSKYNLLSQTDNLFLCTNGLGSKKISSLLTDKFPNLDLVEKAQVFPLINVKEVEIKGKNEKKKIVENNISDWAIETFRKKCKDEKIKAEDIFYYVYGMFHLPVFINNYERNLKNCSPRVPLLAKHFHTLSEIGKKLSKLHLNYERVKETPLKPTKDTLKYLKTKKKIDYNIEKMKISRDKMILTYNKELEFFIPKEAWSYEVNGRTPLEWIVDQYKDYSATKDEIIKLMNRCITVTTESTALIKELSKNKLL